MPIAFGIMPLPTVIGKFPMISRLTAPLTMCVPARITTGYHSSRLSSISLLCHVQQVWLTAHVNERYIHLIRAKKSTILIEVDVPMLDTCRLVLVAIHFLSHFLVLSVV